MRINNFMYGYFSWYSQIFLLEKCFLVQRWNYSNASWCFINSTTRSRCSDTRTHLRIPILEETKLRTSLLHERLPDSFTFVTAHILKVGLYCKYNGMKYNVPTFKGTDSQEWNQGPRCTKYTWPLTSGLAGLDRLVSCFAPSAPLQSHLPLSFCTSDTPKSFLPQDVCIYCCHCSPLFPQFRFQFKCHLL